MTVKTNFISLQIVILLNPPSFDVGTSLDGIFCAIRESPTPIIFIYKGIIDINKFTWIYLMFFSIRVFKVLFAFEEKLRINLQNHSSLVAWEK